MDFIGDCGLQRNVFFTITYGVFHIRGFSAWWITILELSSIQYRQFIDKLGFFLKNNLFDHDTIGNNDLYGGSSVYDTDLDMGMYWGIVSYVW